MAETKPRRRGAHVVEIVVLLVLSAFFVKASYGKFQRGSAEMLDAGADPRLLVVDLVSLSKLAQSTGIPHELRFLTAADGTILGYTTSWQSEFGEPWPVLKRRQFPAGVTASSNATRVEFGAGGASAEACDVLFYDRGRRWRVTVAAGTRELRLIEPAE